MKKRSLNKDGVVSFNRMQPFNPSAANRKPSSRVSRLQALLDSKKPEICVVRGEGIGDVLMTLPTVSALKKTFRGCVLTYATNTMYLDGALVKVLQGNPDIDKVIDRNLLSEDAYDLVVDLHCPALSYEKRENPPLNRIDIFANHAGVKLEDPKPKLYITQEEIEEAGLPLQTIRGKKILVQKFASSDRRSLKAGVLRSTVEKLWGKYGIQSLVLVHTSDYAKDEFDWANVPGAIPLKDKDVREIAAIMPHCDLVLCPDSSILHVAGSLGIPTVSIFGPTHPAARVNYYQSAVALWGGEGIAACPCWYDKCPVGHVCWTKIDADTVVNACIQHMKRYSKVDPERIVDGGSALKEILAERL